MTKSELIKALEPYDNDKVIICMDESGGWDNIKKVEEMIGTVAIIFGGGSQFSDE